MNYTRVLSIPKGNRQHDPRILETRFTCFRWHYGTQNMDYLYVDRYKDAERLEPIPYNVSRAKAEYLGVKFTPLEKSIKDTIESLKEKNFLSI